MIESPRDETAQPDEPFWNRPLTLSFTGFFSALGKATALATVGLWDEAAVAALDAAGAVGIRRTPQQLAGVLLSRAMTRAVYDLLRAYVLDFSREVDQKVEQLGTQLERQLAETPVALNETFLDHPREIPLVEPVRRRLANWLACRQVGEHGPEAIAARLPSYFVYALHREFRENKVDYGPLLRFVDTPVADAWRRERTWHAYTLGLDRELDEPMFGEGFGLRQVFIWPVGYYTKRRPGEDRRPGQALGDADGLARGDREPDERMVVDLREALDHWLEHADQHDAVRLVSGDPGSGKSAFVRMYAWHRAEQGDRVLVIPLHKLNVQDDLAQSIETYCQERDDCPTGLLAGDTAEARLLLVLDGLDELSKQGVLGERIAASFVEEVIRKVNARNERALRVCVLLSGRPIAVQNVADKFRREGQLFHLLPFYVSESERGGEHRPFRYVGLVKQLKEDRRHEWWRRYGQLKGLGYQGLPKELSGGRMEEITAQPLLNYLVALVYGRGNVDFTKDVSRNEVYHDLLDRVYERDWDPARQHKAQAGISRDDFRALLEEMALTAWHGQERTTTASALRARCERTYLAGVLAEYEKRCGEGVSQLFTAFYFRKSSQVIGPEPTFEFTHKSFGEYLTACRIVDALREIDQEFRDREGQRRRAAGLWDEKEALLRWLGVCGPTTISGELMEYVLHEVALRAARNEIDPAAWQRTLVRLIDEALARGMPCEKLPGGLTFQDMALQARNAEEALLVLHSACARITQEVSRIAWPKETSAGQWINRLRGQREGLRNTAALLALNHVDFSGQAMYLIDLYGAFLLGGNLGGAHLGGADLEGANVEGAHLGGAHLQHARISEEQLASARGTPAMLPDGTEPGRKRR